MKKSSERFAILFGVLCGFVVGIIFSAWWPPIEGDSWAPPSCKGGRWFCILYTWQTLIAGGGATVAAFVAAVVAWRAAMKQVEATANIPFEMRRNELIRERLKLEQIVQKLGRYRNAASNYKTFLENTKGLQPSDYRWMLLRNAPISRPTASVLISMAETCQMPGLRADLMNAGRNVSALNENAQKLDEFAFKSRPITRILFNQNVDECIKTRSNAEAVISSIEAVTKAISDDLKLIRFEDERLVKRIFGD